jgi:DNA gyrase/topoisomerase IV subunit B
MARNMKGTKKTRIIGEEKLDDANKAGGAESFKCTLILTEGDSAKSLAMAGLEVIGREYYGVFPLRGKFLNVRDAPMTTVMKNQEVNALIKIIGL